MSEAKKNLQRRCSRSKQSVNSRQSTDGSFGTVARAPGALSRATSKGGRAVTAGDILVLQRSVGNQAVLRLLADTVQLRPRRQRRDIRGLPFYLPLGSDVVAARYLHKYLVGSESKKASRRQKKLIVKRYLGGKSKRWLRGVEVSYNHQWHKMFLLRNFRGTPYEFGLWQKTGSRPTSKSPFRSELQTTLRNDASSYIVALERALRLKPLTGREHAAALLSPKQRKVAIARAQGKQKELAKWLLNDKTWNHLVINRTKLGPTTKGGFFELPSSSQRAQWPKSSGDVQKGDQAYLGLILHNMKQVQKDVDKLRQQVCGSRLLGFIGASKASKAIQWAYSQEILEYRTNLRKLRKNTRPGIEKIIPIKLVWGKKPKTTREVCKMK